MKASGAWMIDSASKTRESVQSKLHLSPTCMSTQKKSSQDHSRFLMAMAWAIAACWWNAFLGRGGYYSTNQFFFFSSTFVSGKLMETWKTSSDRSAKKWIWFHREQSPRCQNREHRSWFCSSLGNPVSWIFWIIFIRKLQFLIVVEEVQPNLLQISLSPKAQTLYVRRVLKIVGICQTHR